jgi:hypothetical protein
VVAKSGADEGREGRRVGGAGKAVVRRSSAYLNDSDSRESFHTQWGWSNRLSSALLQAVDEDLDGGLLAIADSRGQLAQCSSNSRSFPLRRPRIAPATLGRVHARKSARYPYSSSKAVQGLRYRTGRTAHYLRGAVRT